MWIFKYLICLISSHLWIGSIYKYCLRCGKLEVEPTVEHAHEVVR